MYFSVSNSVFKMGKNYYPQVYLEEFKDIVKEKEVTMYITEEQEISTDSKESNQEWVKTGSFLN